MTVLFTGASSFTGFWFVKELLSMGYRVVAVFTMGSVNDYDGVRKTRVEQLFDKIESLWNCRFGDDKFIKCINGKNVDILCHHGADVTNYKSDDFDILRAVQNNANNISTVLDILKRKNCKQIVLTGSVFEGNEGAGNNDLAPFSPYGLSKQLTCEIFRFFAKRKNIKLSKFVIPNPFGPYENSNLTDYLIKTWMKKETATVKTPLYVRDNIHVTLLAKVYLKFIEQSGRSKNEYDKINPSGYIENLGEFTKRFAEQINKKLHINCPYLLNDQNEFNEPKIRTNTHPAADYVKEWREEEAWNELADYYSRCHLNKACNFS